MMAVIPLHPHHMHPFACGSLFFYLLRLHCTCDAQFGHHKGDNAFCLGWMPSCTTVVNSKALFTSPNILQKIFQILRHIESCGTCMKH